MDRDDRAQFPLRRFLGMDIEAQIHDGEGTLVATGGGTFVVIAATPA